MLQACWAEILGEHQVLSDYDITISGSVLTAISMRFAHIKSTRSIVYNLYLQSIPINGLVSIAPRSLP
jgi:hypothetical protein